MSDTNSANPTFAQMLDAVPTRNVRVVTERHGAELLLKVPVKPRWFLTNPFARALLPQKKHHKIALDVIGREVWAACDGHNTVEQIAQIFARKHRVRFHEARMSVSQFLRSLTERGCIVMVVPSPEPPELPESPEVNHSVTSLESHDHVRRDVRRSTPSRLAMEGMS